MWKWGFGKSHMKNNNGYMVLWMATEGPMTEFQLDIFCGFTAFWVSLGKPYIDWHYIFANGLGRRWFFISITFIAWSVIFMSHNSFGCCCNMNTKVNLFQLFSDDGLKFLKLSPPYVDMDIGVVADWNCTSIVLIMPATVYEDSYLFCYEYWTNSSFVRTCYVCIQSWSCEINLTAALLSMCKLITAF